MRFYRGDWYREHKGEAIPPFFLLKKDGWNDYGYTTLFDLYYYASEHQVEKVGRLKILQRGEESTVIPEYFDELPELYCSVGSSLDYYNNLLRIDRERFDQILTSLRDIAFVRTLLREYEAERGIQDSLFRGSRIQDELLKIRKFIVENFDKKPLTQFTAIASLPGFAEPHRARFDLERLDPNGIIPGRMSALIGENGSGKTQLLRKLAYSLSGISDEGCVYQPEKPYFSKVLALSYSAFDDFPESTLNTRITYVYCGLRESGNVAGLTARTRRMADSYFLIRELDRRDTWLESLSRFIDRESLGEIGRYLHGYTQFPEQYVGIENPIQKLSSGQSILLLVFTDLIAHLEPRSMVLVDEPETHLHPSAILNVIDLLVEHLEQYDSYAVVATHSPVVLQYVPSKYVTIFRREGAQPVLRPLRVESFGSDLTSIINDVFKMSGISEVVERRLEQLSGAFSYDEVLALFSGRLSLTARSILASLYHGDNGDPK